MSHQTNLINAPVTMPSDMAAVLRISGTDLQANCQAGVIKKWAKYKPIQYSQVEQLTDRRRQLQNYGLINIPTWSNINKMANYMFNINREPVNYPDCGDKPVFWGYQRPSSYFRLSDFSNEAKTLGYFHGAEAPVGEIKYSSYTIESNGHLRIEYKMGAQDVRTIALGDLTYPRNLSKSVGNMYFGIMLYKPSTGVTYAVTQSNTVSQMTGATVDINGLTSSFNGTYKCFPFISADQISFTSNLGQLTDGDFISLAEEDPDIISIGSSIIKMDIVEDTFVAWRLSSVSMRNLQISISLENNSYQGNLGATVYFEVFNSSNQPMTSATRTVSGVAYGARTILDTEIDMEQYSHLLTAYSVKATVTPTIGLSVATTSATCLVTDGRPR